ncbi:MAG: phosphonopyruvate decarboxylase [Rhodospirillales bacterium]|nr:phosphonopyruvate decarboxylase [Rhodospirillales bacterium]
MIEADDFIVPASERGYNFYTGVPCSFLTPFINRTISSDLTDYVGAASEGEAVAIAAGAWLAGRKTVVMCQNSGLGNCVNPITSLNFPFRIPTLLITTWRGQPGVSDEPQHELMSQITQSLMELIRVRCLTFPRSKDGVAPILDAAEKVMDESGLPFGLIMEKGAVADAALEQAVEEIPEGGILEDRVSGDGATTRYQTLEALLGEADDTAAIIATTGKCGRELFTISDRKQHLYQVGSMGCASGMGLGVALNSNNKVIVLDGDGAALMKLGALATIGAYHPKNLIHIVLDNGSHDSTGGQATVSPKVDFAGVAASCGYQTAWTCDDLAGFKEAMAAANSSDGPHFIRMMIGPGSIDNLGRPTVSPAEVALRFKNFLAE